MSTEEPPDPRAIAFADEAMRNTGGRGTMTPAEIEADMKRTVTVQPWSPFRDPPYAGWAPYCLMCSTMQRMTPTDYGWRCEPCGNLSMRHVSVCQCHGGRMLVARLRFQEKAYRRRFTFSKP